MGNLLKGILTLIGGLGALFVMVCVAVFNFAWLTLPIWGGFLILMAIFG